MNWVQRITLLTVLRFLLLPIELNAQSSGPALSGRVADEQARPLSDAKITIQLSSGEGPERSVTSNRNGYFAFVELADGDYSIRSELAGFASVLQKPVRVRYPAQVVWNISMRIVYMGTEGGLDPITSTLVGELTRQQERIPDAKVCLSTAEPPRRTVCATSNRLGQYLLTVPPERYTVTVETAQGFTANHPIDMRTAGEYRNKIRLEPVEK